MIHLWRASVCVCVRVFMKSENCLTYVYNGLLLDLPIRTYLIAYDVCVNNIVREFHKQESLDIYAFTLYKIVINFDVVVINAFGTYLKLFIVFYSVNLLTVSIESMKKTI